MACLSPSPSGRRLSELLEEKQEPFFLDLHLLEKGCSSSRLLDTAMCWPSAAGAGAGNGNDAAASVLKRLTSKNKTKKQKPPSPARSKNKKTTPASGLLRLLLSKILHGKSAAAVSRKPAALQSSESFKKVVAVEIAGVGEEYEMEEYTDSGSESDEEKQFSPVSVLDQQHHQPFDCSPAAAAVAQGSPKDAMAFVRDLLLLEAAYSPALLTHLLSKSDELIKNTDAINDDDDYYYTSPKNDGADELAAASAAASAYWEAHRAELTRVSEMVAGELYSSSRLDADDVRRERDGVGGELADAVLEDLLLELTVELAGGC